MSGFWIFADNVSVMEIYIPALVQFIFYILILQVLKFFVDLWKWKVANGVSFRVEKEIPQAPPKKKKKRSINHKKPKPSSVKKPKTMTTNPLYQEKQLDDVET